MSSGELSLGEEVMAPDVRASADPSILVDRVRLSKAAKDQLVTLARRTKIEHRNVLCRWALCVSLAESAPPRDIDISAQDGLEIDWRTFTGGEDLLYATLVRERCLADELGLESEIVARQLRLHVHRGLSYLMGDRSMRGIESLISRATSNTG